MAVVRKVREQWRVGGEHGNTVLTIWTNQTARLDFTLQGNNGELKTWSDILPSEGLAWLEDCRQQSLQITKLL